MKGNLTDYIGRRHKDVFYVMDMEYDKGDARSARTAKVRPEILDICFIRCDGETGEKITEYNYRIRPTRELTPHIRKFLNITDEDYKDGLSYEEFVRKANEDIGEDLLNGVEVYNADDDYYVWTDWGEEYLRRHPEVKEYQQCPVLLLSDGNCVALHNVTETLSLRTLYKDQYLVCGNIDISVERFKVFLGIKDAGAVMHRASSDAETLRKVVQKAGKYLMEAEDGMIHIDALTEKNLVDKDAVEQAVNKQIGFCKKRWEYLTDHFEKWLKKLDVTDIDWARAGVPFDEWTGEPYGIGYDGGMDRFKIVFRWWRFAFDKPRYVEEYEAWTTWCMMHQTWHCGMK